MTLHWVRTGVSGGQRSLKTAKKQKPRRLTVSLDPSKKELHDVSENKLKISIKLIVKGHGWSHFCPGKRPYHVVFPIRLMSYGLPRVLCRSFFEEVYNKNARNLSCICTVPFINKLQSLIDTNTRNIYTVS